MRVGVMRFEATRSVYRDVSDETNGSRASFTYSMGTSMGLSGEYCELSARKRAWQDGIMVADTTTTLGGQGSLAGAIRDVFLQIEGEETALDPDHLMDVIRDRWIGGSLGS